MGVDMALYYILGKTMQIGILGIGLLFFSGYLHYLYKRTVFKLPNLSFIGVIIVIIFIYSANSLWNKAIEYEIMEKKQRTLEKK